MYHGGTELRYRLLSDRAARFIGPEPGVGAYYSQETGEVIGSLVKGVSAFCKQILERMPGFQIEIQDGRVRLVHLFLAKLWFSTTNPQDLVTLTYRKLIDVAEEADQKWMPSFA